MQEAIKLNQQRMRKQFKIQEEAVKKQQKKEQRMMMFVLTATIVSMITLTIFVLMLSNNLTDSAVKSCVTKGYSENFCRTHL